MDELVPTITAGAEHHALVEYKLAPEVEAGAMRVAAFLMGYYGSDNTYDLRNPAATITTRDRLALVTVTIKGTPYVIVDIGMRMLTPRELYRAQGFPDNYVIDRGHDGRKFSNKTQVLMVGNSVSPWPMMALIRANADRGEYELLEVAA
jgi:DNA (cytosine-5)-methyltransferase 1